MDFIDYYKILELDKNATESDIKKAYRKLARKYHPDLNPNDEAAKKKFQQINEANEVLGDPAKRKKYDQYGKDWKNAEHFERAGAQQRQYTGNADWQGRADSFGEGGFSDFFESLFGGGSGRRRRQSAFKGQDFTAEMQLRLTDVYRTRKQTVTVNGENIRLTIPAGLENGQTIKIAGYGSPGMSGGPKGDLYITFNIINDTRFQREGSNLYTDVDLPLYTAVLGGEITLDTLDGKVRLKVHPGTQNGAKVKLKGKGFPVYKSETEFGDLYLTYNVKIPQHLSQREKELFQELKKLND